VPGIIIVEVHVDFTPKFGGSLKQNRVELLFQANPRTRRTSPDPERNASASSCSEKSIALHGETEIRRRGRAPLFERGFKMKTIEVVLDLDRVEMLCVTI
jgi:hypothetical protein